MEPALLVGIFMFAAIGGLLLFTLLTTKKAEPPESLVPFCVLPVQNAKAATKAFLELFAGQTAWMDSSVLQCVVLMYRDGDAETAAMCEEIARQYDFFSCMSLSEAQKLLGARMTMEADSEKNSGSGCNFSENAV